MHHHAPGRGERCDRDAEREREHPRIEGNTVILSNNAPVELVLPVLKDMQESKIALSKTMLAEYLKSHPLLYTDGNCYSATAEKQSLLINKLSTYSIAVQLSQTPEPLTWNTTGSICTEWTFENLASLSFAIQSYVKSFVAYQQSTEVAICNCSTVEEVEEIVIDYSNI